MEIYFVNPWHFVMRRAKFGYFTFPGGWGFNFLFVGFSVGEKP